MTSLSTSKNRKYIVIRRKRRLNIYFWPVIEAINTRKTVEEKKRKKNWTGIDIEIQIFHTTFCTYTLLTVTSGGTRFHSMKTPLN